MDEQKSTNGNVALINGLYIGAAMIVYSLVLYLIGLPPDNWLQHFSNLIMLVGVVMAIKQWRDKYNNGLLSYGQSFSFGFLTLLFAGILASVYAFVFFQFIAPDEVIRMTEMAEEKMLERDPNMSDANLEIAMKWTTMMMKPWVMAIWGLVGTVIVALIMSAIVSIFMKKEDKQFL